MPATDAAKVVFSQWPVASLLSTRDAPPGQEQPRPVCGAREFQEPCDQGQMGVGGDMSSSLTPRVTWHVARPCAVSQRILAGASPSAHRSYLLTDASGTGTPPSLPRCPCPPSFLKPFSKYATCTQILVLESNAWETLLKTWHLSLALLWGFERSLLLVHLAPGRRH